MKSGIYKITCMPTGKMYIGSALNFRKRFKDHRSLLNLGNHHSIKLQRAWNKYGKDSFNFEIILACSKENLIWYEQLVMDAYQAVKRGFNVCPIAGNCAGVIPSAESRSKKSRTMSGRKFSDEHKKNLSIAAKQRSSEYISSSISRLARVNTGRNHTEAHKQKISEGVRRARAI